MIKVVKTSEKNIKKFTDSEWPIANFENYGRKHNWKTAKFVYKAIEDDKIVGILTAEYEEGVLLYWRPIGCS